MPRSPPFRASVEAEGGLAQDHPRDDGALVAAHAGHQGQHLFIQLPVGELGEVLVDRQAAAALEDQRYFVGA